MYRHAGPKVLLHPDGSFDICYEQRDQETIWRFVEEESVTRGHGLGFAVMVPTLLRFSKNFLTNHSCQEYLRRFKLFAKKRGVDKIYLNDIYKNQEALQKLLEVGFKKRKSKSKRAA